MRSFWAVFFGILAAVFVVWLVAFVVPAAIRERQQVAADRDTARQIIKGVDFYCSPHAELAIAEGMLEQDKIRLHSLHLDPIELETFDVLFTNRIELLGCGPNAQRQAQEKRRQEERILAAEEHRKFLERDVALQLYSWPSGAVVLIDGESVGSTPLSVTVSPSTHEVKMEKAGYSSYLKSVDVRPGQPRELEVNLVKGP